MPYILLVALLLFSACSSKEYTINGVICPSDHTEQQVHEDLNTCRYYDEKAIAEASKSPLKPACVKCLEEHGYTLEK